MIPNRDKRKRVTSLVVGELSIVDYGANLKEYLVTKGSTGRNVMRIVDKAKKLAKLAEHLQEGFSVLEGFTTEGNSEKFSTSVKTLGESIEKLKTMNVEDADIASPEIVEGISKAIGEALTVLTEITKSAEESSISDSVKSLGEVSKSFIAAAESLVAKSDESVIGDEILVSLKSVGEALESGLSAINALVSKSETPVEEPVGAVEKKEEAAVVVEKKEEATASAEDDKPEAAPEAKSADSKSMEFVSKAFGDMSTMMKSLTTVVTDLKSGQDSISKRLDSVESAFTTSKRVEGDDDVPASKKSVFKGALFGTGEIKK